MAKIETDFITIYALLTSFNLFYQRYESKKLFFLTNIN